MLKRVVSGLVEPNFYPNTIHSYFLLFVAIAWQCVPRREYERASKPYEKDVKRKYDWPKDKLREDVKSRHRP